MMPAKIHTGLYGEYRLKVLRPDKSVRWESGKSPNLIVTSGLRGLYTANGNSTGGCRHACRVGSGSTAPVLGQTSLVDEVAFTEFDGNTGDSVSSNIQIYDAENPTDYHIQERITWQFAQGAAAGNLSEVGVGFRNATNGGALFSRALILDQNGAPTTITVLSDEFLVVEYRFSIYPFINGEISGEVDGYSFRVYPVGATTTRWGTTTRNFNGTSVATNTTILSSTALSEPFDITSSPTAGTNIGNAVSTLSNENYDDTNHTVIKRFSFTPGQGNQLFPAPIRVIRHAGFMGYSSSGLGSGGGAWAVEFTPGIAKDATKSLTIDYLMSWGNYTPPE